MQSKEKITMQPIGDMSNDVKARKDARILPWVDQLTDGYFCTRLPVASDAKM